MSTIGGRREFLRQLGASAGVLPFLLNLSSVQGAASANGKRRLVIVFSPNGVVPKTFWPTMGTGELELKGSLAPLAPWREQTLVLKGISDRIRGDGDNHMRGIGCLLTGIELFPGNIQGGSDTPAGWSKGHSIDQEIANFLQSNPETRTRFGSLEFGVMVPDRADTWTRMVYAGPNRPLAPISDPYQMFSRLYRPLENRASLVSVLDDLVADLDKVRAAVSSEDKQLLDEHLTLVREMERELRETPAEIDPADVPELEPGVRAVDAATPKLSRMQIELLVNSLRADFCRVATLQYTNSVSDLTMPWLNIDRGHHSLSHEPDKNEDAQQKLTAINQWYCGEVAYLAQRLAETPEPGGEGSLLDHTTIVWTNELGKGNSHTLDNIPFVLVGGGLGFRMGRALEFRRVAHNRLLLSLAHGMGHPISQFGNPDYCGDGPLAELS
jgi:hypothetical protein